MGNLNSGIDHARVRVRGETTAAGNGCRNGEGREARLDVRMCGVHRMEPRATSAQRLKQDLFLPPSLIHPSLPPLLWVSTSGSFDSLPSDAKKTFLFGQKPERESQE
jgi:hypothetical protein